jgi:hypothetical protein
MSMPISGGTTLISNSSRGPTCLIKCLIIFGHGWENMEALKNARIFENAEQNDLLILVNRH